MASPANQICCSDNIHCYNYNVNSYNYGQKSYSHIDGSLEDLAILFRILFWRISLRFKVTKVKKIGAVNTFLTANASLKL